MIAIVDYGCGNLFSLKSSLSFLGLDCRITGDADEIRSADKIILPGVGAIGKYVVSATLQEATATADVTVPG